MADTPNRWGIDREEVLRIDKRDFDVRTLDDELRTDDRCKNVLKHFYLQLLDDGLSPAEATPLANSADYFVRDYLVSFRQRNLFEEKPGIVRQFAGNWYIVNTLEPDLTELTRYLKGIGEFYRFLCRRGFISESFLKEIERECADAAFYEQRIEAFWNITGDGYEIWEKECSLKIK